MTPAVRNTHSSITLRNSFLIIHSPYAGTANVVGLAGGTPSNRPYVSRAAEAAPPPHGKGQILGRQSRPKPHHRVSRVVIQVRDRRMHQAGVRGDSHIYFF